MMTLLLTSEAYNLRRWWVKTLTCTFPVSFQKQVYIGETWEFGRGKTPRGSAFTFVRGGGAESWVQLLPKLAPFGLATSPFVLAFLPFPHTCGILHMQGEVAKEVPRPG